jgi:hypothetical protein
VDRADIVVAECLVVQPLPSGSCRSGCSILPLPFCRGAFQFLKIFDSVPLIIVRWFEVKMSVTWRDIKIERLLTIEITGGSGSRLRQHAVNYGLHHCRF